MAEPTAKRARGGGEGEPAAPPSSRPAMTYADLGGMKVSSIALGCFSFGGDHTTGSHLGARNAALHKGVWGEQSDDDTFATVKAALAAGVNFFDNAEIYGGGYAERVTGRALKAAGAPRGSYYIATKVAESNMSAELVRKHALASIDRMDCEYIDLYQLHWHSRAALRTEKYPERPLAAEVPLEETLRAVDGLRKEGKVRHVGVCNFGVEDLRRALATGVPIVSNQICYNLLWRGIEEEVLPFCAEHGIAVLPWSPLGQGLLTGKFATPDDVPPGRQRTRLFSNKRPQQRHGEAGLEKETFAAIGKLSWIAERRDPPTPLANLALAWLRRRPEVRSVLMGARNVRQLERNLESLRVELGSTEAALIDDATDELRRRLGHGNLDPYEGADSSRIR